MCIAAIFDGFCTHYRWSNVNCQLCKGMKNYVREWFLLLCSIWGHLYFLKDVNILSTHINGKKHFSSQLFLIGSFVINGAFYALLFLQRPPTLVQKLCYKLLFHRNLTLWLFAHDYWSLRRSGIINKYVLAWFHKGTDEYR